MLQMSKNVYEIKSKFTHLYFRTSVSPLLPKKKLDLTVSLALLCFEQFVRNELKLKAHAMELNLTICGAKRMQTLNDQYRNKLKPTDVLSFPIEVELYRLKQLPPYLTQHLMLGDIVICKEVLLRQAKEFGVTAQQELVRLLIHGLLHLTDMDHERSKTEEKMMFEIQERLIAQVMKKLN